MIPPRLGTERRTRKPRLATRSRLLQRLRETRVKIAPLKTDFHAGSSRGGETDLLLPGQQLALESLRRASEDFLKKVRKATSNGATRQNNKTFAVKMPRRDTSDLPFRGRTRCCPVRRRRRFSSYNSELQFCCVTC